MAIWQDWYFVGEPVSFKNPGRVHVYCRAAEGAWQLAHTLVGGRMNDGFGQSVAASGGVLLVSERGAVHAYYLEDSAWQAGAMLSADSAAAGTGFGASTATDGRYAFVGAPAQSEGAGAVYVFSRGEDGWEEEARLEPEGDEQRFGSALAWGAGHLLVGSPGFGAGSATLYQADAESGGWLVSARLAGSDAGVARSFGTAVHLFGHEAVVGAPRDRDFGGAAHVFGFDGMSWSYAGMLAPEEAEGRRMFGSAVHGLGNDLWVGAPGADGGIYRYRRDTASGGWIQAEVWAAGPARRSNRLGTTLAAAADVVLAAMPGADYGEGRVLVLGKTAEGAWREDDVLMAEILAMDAIVGSQVDCQDGAAGSYSCSEMDLISFLPQRELGAGRGVRLNDVWGWTDTQTGKEYALVGHLEGAVFVDVSSPMRPVFLGELPRTAGSPGSTWRDIKVYRDHAFIVADGAGAHGMQVFDLTQLRSLDTVPVSFEETAHYDRIHSAHNIVVNEETGFAFAVGASGGGETCGGGLHMIDIRDPQSPSFAGCFSDATTGRRKTGYSHDAQCIVYRGPDTEHLGKQICVGANETAISISDVTDKEHPVAIGSGSYPDAGYVHQGWLSQDHRYFYQNDELDELAGKAERTRTLVWDVSDLDDPVMVKEYFGPTSATDHNLYVRDNLMYQTNNASGLRVLDITVPEDPVEVGYFDTTPYGVDQAGFNGTWSSYPYFKSGIVVVTSRREGLFIVKKRAVDT